MWQNSVTSAQFTASFKKQFELCKLRPGETVVFLTDQGADQDVVSAGLAAALELGGIAYQICISKGPDDRYMGTNPLEAPGLIEALGRANLIISFFVGFFSGWEAVVRKSGGRILNVLDTADQLMRLQGTAELKAAATAARDRLKKTKRIQVTSEVGTDFSWDVNHDAPFFCHYGAADEPGRMDQWGQGMVAMFPVEGSAKGRVIVQPGDVWILPYARLVQSPIELDVESGFIQSVSGGLDAKIFKSWLDDCRTSESDFDPYAVSHLGWGLNPKARWLDAVNHEHQMDQLVASMRSFPGSFLFSTGPGHKRKTKGHIDMPMCDCTIKLDGEVVIEKGRIVDSAMVVDPKRSTH